VLPARVDVHALLGKPERKLERRIAERSGQRFPHEARRRDVAELDDEISDPSPLERRPQHADEEGERERDVHELEPVDYARAADVERVMRDRERRDDQHRRPRPENRRKRTACGRSRGEPALDDVEDDHRDERNRERREDVIRRREDLADDVAADGERVDRTDQPAGESRARAAGREHDHLVSD
jgi:hypothetical protein